MFLKKKTDDNTCIEMPELSSNGNVVLVLGNNKTCEPCKILSKFLKKNKRAINADIVEVDNRDFTKCFTGVRIRAIPRVIFIKDGSVIHTEEGYRGGNSFMELLKDKFGDDIFT